MVSAHLATNLSKRTKVRRFTTSRCTTLLWRGVYAYAPDAKKSESGLISAVFSQGWIKPRKVVETYQICGATIEEVPIGDKAILYTKYHCEHCDKVAQRYGRNPENAAAANAKAIIGDMPIDREAMADLGEALAADDLDAARNRNIRQWT